MERKHPLAVCEIPLTNSNQVALVSYGDYDRVMARKWYLTSNGYVKATDHTNPRWLHLFVMKVQQGIDHIDCDPLNNTRENLRVATQSQNIANSRKRNGNYTSIHKGVYLNGRGKWIAQICVDGKSKYLGSFDTEREAADRYDEAAKEVFGEYARINAS